LIFILLELLAETLSRADKEIGTRNLLMIEEPEIYMHPQMERKIADTLYEIAASKKAQIICTTHSPVFIRPLEFPQSLVRLFKGKSGSVSVSQKSTEVFSGSENEKKTLRMIMDFDPSVNELFFSKRVVLVEGDTESAVFPRAAELLDLFNNENKQKKREVSLINCRSRNTIPLFQEVLNFYEIPYIIIHDLDNERVNEGKNAEILTLLNDEEERRMCFDPKIEDVLEIPEGKPKWFQAITRIETLHSEGKLEEKLGSFVKFVYGT
jgi:predicted ATP-dependent endonuclease of OLD family